MDDNIKKENLEENKSNSDVEQKQKCCTELQDVRNRCLYLTAEFDNYKKRIEKEKSRWLEDGQNITFKELLPIVDDFHRAFDKLKDQNLSPEMLAHFEGIKLIAKELDKFLVSHGIEETKYHEFNPEIHEALMQVESTKHQQGQIVDVLEKGYIRRGLLLKPAKVSVAK